MDREVVKLYQGKSICSFLLEEEALLIRFTDDSALKLFDEGQQCCEQRYLRSDDDFRAVEGAQFLDAQVREAAESAFLVDTNNCGIHEVQFLVILTSLGELTISAHNEHNGYYGGFTLSAEEVKS